MERAVIKSVENDQGYNKETRANDINICFT